MHPIQWQIDLIKRYFTPRAQMVTGVVMLDGSVLYLVYWPFSGEPFGIFTMSVWAMLFGGIIMVAEAIAAEKREKK